MIDLTAVTFHDEPPSRRTYGARFNPDLQAFLDLCKANPGKWAKYPEPYASSTATLLRKSHGFLTRTLNQDGKGRGDMWVCWPAEPAATPKAPPTPNATTKPAPAAKDPFGVKPTPAVKGKVLRCADCGWETGINDPMRLIQHCQQEHGRRATKVERMPVNETNAA